LAGFTRYSRDRSFAVLGQNKRFVLLMAAGSIVGSFIVGQLLGIVPTAVLLPLLAAILVISCAGAFCNTFGMDFRCWNFLWPSACPELIIGLGIATINLDAAREVWTKARGRHRTSEA
jgi:hypothetical protein